MYEARRRAAPTLAGGREQTKLPVLAATAIRLWRAPPAAGTRTHQLGLTRDIDRTGLQTLLVQSLQCPPIRYSTGKCPSRSDRWDLGLSMSRRTLRLWCQGQQRAHLHVGETDRDFPETIEDKISYLTDQGRGAFTMDVGNACRGLETDIIPETGSLEKQSLEEQSVCVSTELYDGGEVPCNKVWNIECRYIDETGESPMSMATNVNSVWQCQRDTSLHRC